MDLPIVLPMKEPTLMCFSGNTGLTGLFFRVICCQVLPVVFKSDETIGLPFHRVRFMGYTRQTTLVPDEYFDSSEIGDYIRFNLAGEVDHELFNNLIYPSRYP